MTYEEALQKAVKLLRLSQSSNPNKAALAAGKAQEIIDRYNIESVALDMASGDKPQPDEPIKDFSFDPLDAGTKKISTWSWRLFTVISRGNGCKGYLTRNNGGGIAIVGRPSDVQTVRYFYAWLKKEVERLAGRDCRDTGRTWANNYRNGVVDTIKIRLEAQKKETQATVTKEILDALPPEQRRLALVRVNNAIAKVAEREQQAGAWMKSNFRLTKGTVRYSVGVPSARAAGQKAGHEIRIKPAAGQLR